MGMALAPTLSVMSAGDMQHQDGKKHMDQCEISRCDAVLSPFIQEVRVGSSCQECGRYRFFKEESAYLYLLTNPELGLHKIGFGIVKNKLRKIEDYCQNGWSAFGIWHTTDTKAPLRTEREIFKAVKVAVSAGKPTAVDPMGEWVEGWASSIAASAISLPALVKIIEGEMKKAKWQS